MNPVLALIIANVIWGAAAPIFKFALTNVPPFTLAFCRFFFAAFFFLPFVLRFKFSQLTRGDWAEIIVGALFGITANISFFFLGLEKTESINAPIIASAEPLMLFVLSVLFLHETFQRRVLGGMLVSLMGVLLIIFAPILFDGKTVGDHAEVLGNVLLVLAALAAVIAPLFWKRVLEKLGPYPILFIAFLFSSATFLPFAYVESTSWHVTQLNFAGAFGILFGIIFSSAVAYFLYFYGLAKITAQEVGLFTYIDPVIGVLVAIPLLHEYPNLYFFLGSLMVFGGIYISEGRIHYHPFHKLRPWS